MSRKQVKDDGTIELMNRIRHGMVRFAPGELLDDSGTYAMLTRAKNRGLVDFCADYVPASGEVMTVVRVTTLGNIWYRIKTGDRL